jgi:hypothetical protein
MTFADRFYPESFITTLTVAGLLTYSLSEAFPSCFEQVSGNEFQKV